MEEDRNDGRTVRSEEKTRVEFWDSGSSVFSSPLWKELLLRRFKVSKVQAAQPRVLSVSLSACFGCHQSRRNARDCFVFCAA